MGVAETKVAPITESLSGEFNYPSGETPNLIASFANGQDARGDGKNFNDGDMFEVKGETDKYLVLVNMHGDAELNTENKFAPGKRTLNWQVPLEYASLGLKTLGDTHNNQALLPEWGVSQVQAKQSTQRQVIRNQATFTIVPPGTKLEYVIGTASEQEGLDKRLGGGVQMRMKEIPKGALAITVDIKLEEGTRGDVSREDKKIKFDETYAEAMKALQKHYDDNGLGKIPQELEEIDKRLYTTALSIEAANELMDEFKSLSPEKQKTMETQFKKYMGQFDIERYVNEKFPGAEIRETSPDGAVKQIKEKMLKVMEKEIAKEVAGKEKQIKDLEEENDKLAAKLDQAEAERDRQAALVKDLKVEVEDLKGIGKVIDDQKKRKVTSGIKTFEEKKISDGGLQRKRMGQDFEKPSMKAKPEMGLPERDMLPKSVAPDDVSRAVRAAAAA
ncbi:MAG: hypothetical protein H6679_01150 [Epsilonproteobacteria bacterium]|nr:hypothetical protein [Campylobacterota bacterium]